MRAFNFTTTPQQIIFAPNSLTKLPDVIAQHGWQRPMLITSPSLTRGDTLRELDGVFAASYDQVQAHVQDFQLAEALTIAAKHRIDGLIGIGGGSVIGMAKAISHKRDTIPVVAIPTTYAGSEMTPIYGITHTDTTPPRKVTVDEPRIVPQVVIYDPALTISLLPDVTAASGINALAHCCEALYSITRNPLSTAAAQDGIRRIASALPRCASNGADIEARGDMQIGAYLAGLSLASAAMGLHHGLCHALGGTLGVAHGAANSIMLPHALGFNVDAAVPELALAGRAMGLPDDDEEAAYGLVDHLRGFIKRLGLPQRLRDVGVQQSDLRALAPLAMKSRAVQNNPKPLTELQIEAIYQAAW
jgi:maleylacetate reductase